MQEPRQLKANEEERRDKGRFRWSPMNKMLVCKTRIPICTGKVPTLSFNTANQMYALQRFATSETYHTISASETLYTTASYTMRVLR